MEAMRTPEVLEGGVQAEAFQDLDRRTGAPRLQPYPRLVGERKIAESGRFRPSAAACAKRGGIWAHAASGGTGTDPYRSEMRREGSVKARVEVRNNPENVRQLFENL